MQRPSFFRSPLVCTTLFALACAACSGATASDPAGRTVASGGASGASPAGSYGSEGPAPCFSCGGSGDLGGASGTGGGSQIKIPVREIAGLASITFFERTGGDEPTPYTFLANGPELTEELADPLGELQFDIPGAPTEYYDVYYSDENGDFDENGSYLTISGVFGMTAPWGGGLNLAEIALNFANKPTEYGNYVASFVSNGDNKDDASVDNCIDGDLQTETTMGNTVGASSRLRLTLGFLSSSGPPPIK